MLFKKQFVVLISGVSITWLHLQHITDTICKTPIWDYLWGELVKEVISDLDK